MLETIITTIKPSPFALIPFEPRSVTLAKHHQQQQKKMKNKKTSSETLEVDSQGKFVVEKSTQKSKKKKKRSNDSSSSLLHSIAIYLENKGFAKTLSAFKSESLIDEELDGLKEHKLDLEEMYTKYLEISKDDVKTNSNGSEKLDSQKEEVAEEDKGTKCDAVTEPISKVKGKERKEEDASVVSEQHEVSNGFTKEKKKKSKLVPDSSGENTREVGSEAAQDPADTMVFKAQPEELDNKLKDKNKKKNKRTSETLTENVEQSVTEALPKVSIEKTSAEEKNVKSKDKKRKKSKPTSEDDAKVPEKEDLEKPDSSKEEKNSNSETPTQNVEQSVMEALPKVSIEKISAEEKNVKSKDKKRKKSQPTSEDDAKEPEKEDLEKPDSIKEEKNSKKRKRPSSEENKSQPDEKIVTKESKQSNNKVSEEKGGDGDQVVKENILQESGHAEKKRKTEHVQEEVGQHANGSHSNSGKQGSTRKQPNGSAEPKTVNAFKRVDVEKVEFISEKLQDNSYWAKDGADSGYGAKAQEVLGQVRGRDFRHEKTKKKRGSYRGGQIDLQSHSFKFDNSDDE